MKTSNIIISAIAIIILIGAVSITGMYFSYNNQELSLRNQAEAQRGKIEGTYDKMWKILKQKAQVTDEYKDAFKEIYPQLIEGRYSQGDGSLMKWIQESNPTFDTSLYKDLMQSIEVERSAFQTSQERMLDIIREHKTLCYRYPAKFFISDASEIEYTVISSSISKATMQLGEDNDIDLFSK